MPPHRSTGRIYREQLLKACFGNSEESRPALETCAAFDEDEVDVAMRRLLPFLYRRWGALASSNLIDLAHRAYIATWQQNRERMAEIGLVLSEFERVGIECMLLKGAALTLRHYRDYGLRNMGDFDLLIHHDDIEPAINALLQNGWIAEGGCSAAAILRQSRVRHAWQFFKGDTQNCDLHWRPLAQCYCPQVSEMFWGGAESVKLGSDVVKVPCPTDQLFHVCVHAMHWEWTPNLYWVADALTLLRDAELDWDRAAALAVSADMRMRFTQALAILESEFHAVVPKVVPKHVLGGQVASWERREHFLMQKPCPLGVLDSIAWHVYHFRRLRPFDTQWRELPVWSGFTQYVATFLDALTLRALIAKAWAQVKLRVR